MNRRVGKIQAKTRRLMPLRAVTQATWSGAAVGTTIAELTARANDGRHKIFREAEVSRRLEAGLTKCERSYGQLVCAGAMRVSRLDRKLAQGRSSRLRNGRSRRKHHGRDRHGVGSRGGSGVLEKGSLAVHRYRRLRE